MIAMPTRFPRTFLVTLAAPLIWAAHYLFVYSVNGIACARPEWQSTWAGMPVSSWIIVAASVAALAGMGAIHLHSRNRLPALASPGFLPRLSGALSLLSAVAVVWETIPVMLVPACG